LGAALDGAGVDANVFDPVEIERDAAIGLEGAILEVSEGGVGRGGGWIEAMRGSGGFGDVGHDGKLSGERRVLAQKKSYHFAHKNSRKVSRMTRITRYAAPSPV
jgi:hypothetical protein